MTNPPPTAPEPPPHDPQARAERIAAIQRAAKGKGTPGPCAARSQDFLYDENGLPK